MFAEVLGSWVPTPGCSQAALLLVRLAAALNASKSELERAKMDLELDVRTLK